MKNCEYIRRIDTSIDGFRYYEGLVTKASKECRVWCYPSVTTKVDAVYPKDAFLIKWIREQGLGGQAIFEKAAEEGTESHIIIDRMIKGERIPTEDLSDSVKKYVQAFIDWAEEFKPEIILSEEMLVNHEYQFAGTCDLVCRLDYEKGKTKYSGVYVVDYKTSNSVQEKHKIQNAAYWSCGNKTNKTAILHLGNRTKKGYSFIDYEPQPYWEKFIHFNKTFELLYGNPEPRIKTYPEVFELNLKTLTQ